MRIYLINLPGCWRDPALFILVLSLAGIPVGLNSPSLGGAQERIGRLNTKSSCVKSESGRRPMLQPYSALGSEEEKKCDGSRLILTAGKIPVPLKTVKRGQHSGVREPLQTVIRTRPQWKSLWKRHSVTGVHPTPAPAIDFATEIVVGIFLGEKRTGGYDVEIIRAERRDSTLFVYYREKSPSPDMMLTQVITQPYHLVTVPRYETPLIFLRESP